MSRAGDYRLSIDRSCLCFKRTYALRTECERYNSRFKASGQERLWVRNGNSAANLNTLAHISALAVALAAVLHVSHSYRSAKQLRRSAWSVFSIPFSGAGVTVLWFLRPWDALISFDSHLPCLWAAPSACFAHRWLNLSKIIEKFYIEFRFNFFVVFLL